MSFVLNYKRINANTFRGQHMHVSLRDDSERFVEEKVKKGQYETPEDVVEDALDLLRHVPEWTDEELRQEIAIGLAQLDRGEGAPWNVEEMKADGRRLLAEYQKRR